MFSNIHPSFQHHMWKIAFFCALFIIVGLVVLGFGLKPNLEVSSRSRVGVGPARVTTHRTGPHPATARDRAFIVLVGVVFAGAGGFMIASTAKWLQRATTVRENARPIPMRMTTRVVEDGYGSKRKLNLLASLRPDSADAAGAAITDLPLYQGVTFFGTRYRTVTDAPVLVYLDSDPASPVVIQSGTELLCSQQSYKHPHVSKGNAPQQTI